MANAVKVSATQLPQVHGCLVEACDILGVAQVPDLYVKQNPAPNAYTLAIGGEKPFIVVHSSLLEMCTLAEVQAVVAHELGHLKCEHGVWLSLGNLGGVAASQVPILGSLMDAGLTALLREWQRAAELSCDRAALLVAQNPKVVTSALLKLVGGGGLGGGGGEAGSGGEVAGAIGDGGAVTGVGVGAAGEALREGLNVDAFLEQAAAYRAALEKASPAERAAVRAATEGRSHPVPAVRVAELDAWARGPEYHGIIKRGKEVSLQK